MLAKLTSQIKAQHGNGPAELTVNREMYGYFTLLLLYFISYFGTSS